MPRKKLPKESDEERQERLKKLYEESRLSKTQTCCGRLMEIRGEIDIEVDDEGYTRRGYRILQCEVCKDVVVE